MTKKYEIEGIRVKIRTEETYLVATMDMEGIGYVDILRMSLLFIEEPGSDIYHKFLELAKEATDTFVSKATGKEATSKFRKARH